MSDRLRADALVDEAARRGGLAEPVGCAALSRRRPLRTPRRAHGRVQSGRLGPTSSPMPASSVSPTEWSIAILGARAPAAERHDREAERARVDRGDGAVAWAGCTACTTVACGRCRRRIARRNPAGRRAPLTIFWKRSAARPLSSASRAIASPSAAAIGEAAERQHLAGEREHDRLEPRVAPRAGEEVDGVQHLDGIAGGGSERLVHVGDERARLQPRAVGDGDEALARARAPTRCPP